jgi:hypothetical protein
VDAHLNAKLLDQAMVVIHFVNEIDPDIENRALFGDSRTGAVAHIRAFSPIA